MKISILDAATLGEDLSLEVFKQYGEVTVYDVTRQEQVEERLEGAEAVILNKVKLNAGNLANAKDLKLICITATGFDNVDVAYCREHGIAVCNVVGYSTQCVAQITVTMVLSLLANLPEYNRFVTSGEYTKTGLPNRLSPAFCELSGKTWGIVGYGNIGKRVADIARAIG